MLEFRQLVKDYGQVRAVNGVSFQVNPGEIVGLLGPNGAGKTSALRCAAGILVPSGGQVLVNGADIVTDQATAKGRLSYVPEVPSLYELLTVKEHMRFVAMCYRTLDVFEEKADILLDKYDLAEKKDQLVATLSKGMRQKLAIACAMVHRANVFLFDEPMIGIDPAGVAEFKQELFDARDAGASILVSTHLLDTAERLCDRVVIMARGNKVIEGSLEQLRAERQAEGQTLEQIFLSLTEGH